MYNNMNCNILSNKTEKMNCNGRIDLLCNKDQPDLKNLFAMYDKIPANQCTTFRDATEGQWTATSLSNTFFSKENIQIIQNGIRAGVYEKSNGQYIIGEQDCDSLKIIMRSIFLQNSANQLDNVSLQVEQLNNMVLDYCIHNVYSEAQGYMKYLYDASTIAMPLATPMMETQSDTRCYKMPNWF